MKLNKNINIYHGDCLEVMDRLIEQDIVVDSIITDPPYGTTACSWDSVIPFDEMWSRLNKLINPNGAIVLFGSQPFSSSLIMSNIGNFKYEWIWKKNAGSNFGAVKYQPMKEHENILIFGDSRTNYYPIMQPRTDSGAARQKYAMIFNTKSDVYGNSFNKKMRVKITKHRVPSSVQKFNRERGLHPTQKPVSLMEYLIKTYTNENEIVLDFTMGSGSTGVACINTNRKFIGIELDDKYFDISKNRLSKAIENQNIKNTKTEIINSNENYLL